MRKIIYFNKVAVDKYGKNRALGNWFIAKRLYRTEEKAAAKGNQH